jgi:hypothetical protein
MLCLFSFLHAMLLMIANTGSHDILTKMNQAVNAHSSMEFNFRMEERWFGEYKIAENKTRIMYKPFKVYMKFTISSSPAKEVLYNPALYQEHALINLGKMLPNVKLSPLNSKMRHEQHYTILNAGFNKINSVLQAAKNRFGKDLDKHCIVEDNLAIHGRNVYRLTFIDPNFGYETYQLKRGETSTTLALKYNLCEYLIIEKNNVKSYDKLKEGMTIQLPKTYCKKCIIYIDKQSYLPIHQEIHDDKGLMEKYVYTNINVDKKFTDEDFKKDSEGFGF